MKFKEIIPSYNDFLTKIWIPIKNIFEMDRGVSLINLDKLYFIINNYYNDSTIIDQENVFLEKIQYRLSYILPSLWFHQILLNTINPQDLSNTNNWGNVDLIENKNQTNHDFNKENNTQNVIGITNTSDQVTQSWDLLPDLTKNKGDFIIEKNFNLNKLMDKITEQYNTQRNTKIAKNNLIENFTKNLNKVIVNNHNIIIKNLESLFIRWVTI